VSPLESTLADPPGPLGPPVFRVVLIGLAAGLLGGMFGVGGGLLIVPALVLVLGFEQRLAHGTSLAAILPIALASLVTYWTVGNVDWPAALWLSLGALGGAVAGTKLLQILPHRTLALGFTAVLAITAIRLFFTTEAIGRQDLTLASMAGLVIVGALSGILAGLLGVGGGVIMVPAMIVLFGIEPVVAKGTSVAVIIPTALMGTWRNRTHSNADLKVGAVIGTCGMISAVAGGLIADQMSPAVSNALFAGLLIVVIARQLRTVFTLPVGSPS
jgi:uncharacterized membrane protein YfcA